jgi:hypothetical protein
MLRCCNGRAYVHIIMNLALKKKSYNSQIICSLLQICQYHVPLAAQAHEPSGEIAETEMAAKGASSAGC